MDVIGLFFSDIIFFKVCDGGFDGVFMMYYD